MIEYFIRLKRNTKPFWKDRWVWQMAWRDARHNLPRLFLLVASLITGIAAVVAIGSLNDSIQRALDSNARELLGADLVINSNKRVEQDLEAQLDSARVEKAYDADMPSMVMFMNSKQSRLVKLTALKGPFPFYGKIETQPGNAYDLMKAGRYALLDESLARQYEVSSDDSVKIGSRTFRVAGVVTRYPGGGALTSTMAPSVYISLDQLDSTGLVQFGSRINYGLYVLTGSEERTAKLNEEIKPLIKKYRYSVETVERRREGLGKSFQSVYQFFALLAFIALVLGCLGIASSVHIYAREKRDEVAVLRCLGSSGWQAFYIYFIQMFFLGLAGSVLGVAVGAAIQTLIPILFKGYVPVDVPFDISWMAVGEGVLLGAVVTVLFTMLPLASVRFVPPLTVLRAGQQTRRPKSRMRTLALSMIFLFPLLTSWYQTGKFVTALGFTLGIVVVLATLAGVAWLLLKGVRKFFPSGAGFIFRHALSSLYRPNNQTQVLMVTIGLGGFIIATLNIVQNSLLGQVEFAGNQNQSNTILFDIQSNQRDGVIKLMNEHQLPPKQVVPIITCRLREVKGKKVEAWLADSVNRIPEWALMREYRVTYRDSLHVSEELVKGKMHAFYPGRRDSVYVTVSEGMHETLRVDIGDSLMFDIQGIPLMAHVNGVRKVDWPKDPPNFLFVFPKGVLEEAPQIWVTSTRINDTNQANRFQQALVTLFPNVSLIDLRLVLRTVEELFAKVAMTIRFLALFSIVTGLVVLAGAVVNSKYIRMKENVLLRTIGARSRQILGITLVEYAYLGLFSALTGMILSVAGGWLLCYFFFEVSFNADWLGLIIVGASVTSLTILIGWWNSREVILSPPLQVLRRDQE